MFVRLSVFGPLRTQHGQISLRLSERTRVRIVDPLHIYIQKGRDGAGEEQEEQEEHRERSANVYGVG